MSSPLSAAGFGLTPPQNPSAGLMSGVDWVKGQVIVDPQYQAKFIELLPTIKWILSGVRDAHPFELVSPEPAKFLPLLGLGTNPIVYFSQKQMNAAGPDKIKALETVLQQRIDGSQRQEAQTYLNESTRIRGIITKSISAPDLGLIRGLLIEKHTLAIKYCPTNSACKFRDNIRLGMRAAGIEVFHAIKGELNLKNASITEVAEVWNENDMAPHLRAMLGAAVTIESRRAINITLGGVALSGTRPTS